MDIVIVQFPVFSVSMVIYAVILTCRMISTKH
jgi:hypothetical protein